VGSGAGSVAAPSSPVLYGTGSPVLQLTTTSSKMTAARDNMDLRFLITLYLLEIAGKLTIIELHYMDYSCE
jgi:hypothetical protein